MCLKYKECWVDYNARSGQVFGIAAKVRAAAGTFLEKNEAFYLS